MLKFKQFISERAITYNALKHNDLTKRGGARVNVFLNKIKDGEEFLTKKGAVKLAKAQLGDLKKTFTKAGFKAKLKTTNPPPKDLDYPNDFLKTPEFGGKGAGSGTAAEDRELGQLRKAIEAAMVKAGVSILPMTVGGRNIDVVGVDSTPGTPKSDFHLVDPDGNEVAWISHKDGSKPTHFQQYGGLSGQAFASNTEVAKFMNDLKTKFPEGMKRGESAWRTCKDKKVIMQSVWGVDYGGARGRNNVDEFHQGPMKIVKSGGRFVITSNHSDTNGKIPKTPGYECIYFARFTGDRGARAAGVFVDNVRVGVFPKAKAPKTAKEM